MQSNVNQFVVHKDEKSSLFKLLLNRHLLPFCLFFICFFLKNYIIYQAQKIQKEVFQDKKHLNVSEEE